MHKKLLVIFKLEMKKVIMDGFDSLKKDGIDTQYTYLDKVFFNLSSDSYNIEFPYITDSFDSFDLVYFRALKNNKEIFAGITRLYPKVPLLQTIKAPNYDNKLYQYSSFAHEGLSIPHTLYFHGYKGNEIKDKVLNIFKYPFVAKRWNASHGRDCYLIHTEEEFDKALSIVDDHGLPLKYIFQEYIENDSDMRIVVINGKVKFAINRVRDANGSEWRNNTALGAERVLLNVDDISDEVKTLAINAAKALGYTIGGVDIVIGKEDKKARILEINVAPEFKPGTAEAIVEYAREMLLGN